MNEDVKKETVESTEIEIEEVKKEQVEEKVSKKEEKASKKEEKKEKKDKFEKKLEAKEEELKKANEEAIKYKNLYLETLANLANQRKLYEKDYQNALKYASQNLTEKLLPSFEMFSMVVESVDNLPPEVAPYVQGFSMIYRQMVGALESEGISEIVVKVGDKYDYKIHSAMETQEVEDDTLVDTITKVIRKGYKIHDRLIKPATVIVGKKKVSEEVKNNENETQAEA